MKHLIFTMMSFTLMACKNDTKHTNENTTVTLVTNEIKHKPIAPKPIIKSTIKVALLLDTSNSMDGLIDQAKTQLWQIVNELSHAKCQNEKPNLNIALYEYGNDGIPASKGHIRQISAFTNDLDDISEKLFALNTMGGNEYCGQVIKTSIDDLNWGNNKQDLKLVFIAGNEPFTQGPVNYIDATTDAKEKDITINTIFCGDYNLGVSGMWQQGALITSGDYMSINQNQKTVHIDTPFDKHIVELNTKLNDTYIPYGTNGKKKLEVQSEQDSNAYSYGNANGVGRIVSKSNSFYYNSSWDLVDAESEDNFDLKSIDKSSLPETLQNKSDTALKTYIDNKRSEREKIKLKINEYNQKRVTYIKNLKDDNSSENGLENALIKAIKKQAKKKNYTWDSK